MSTNMLFYSTGTSPSESYGVNTNGQLTLLTKFSNFSKTWTRIIQVASGIDGSTKKPFADLFFYDAPAGKGEFYRMNEAGNISLLSSSSGFARTWSQIVVVPFEFHSNIMFYDAAAGHAEVFRYVGRGRMSHLRSLTNLSQTWTHIVPGVFGGEFGGLLTYDASLGHGEVYRMDNRGNLRLVKVHTDFSKHWTHIVPIPFGFRTDLLFYKASSGYGEVYRLDTDGNFEQLQRSHEFSTKWSQILPMSFENEHRHALLFFYDPSGKGEMYHIDGLGRFHLQKQITSLTQNWKQIVPLMVYQSPPIYHIRVQAVVTANDGGSPFTSSFRKTDIQPIVGTTNVIYREAGIHLDFDPNTDVEEIQSTLLNRDFTLDSNGNNTIFFDPKLNTTVLPLTPAPDELPLYPEGQARQDLGWRYRGKLVIIFRDTLGNDSLGRPRMIALNFTSDRAECIILAKGAFIAHELGHYLHLPHPFGYEKGFSEAANIIKQWVESQPEAQTALSQKQPIPQNIIDRGLEALDGDALFGLGAVGGAARKILDTPPDAGFNIFTEAGFQVGKPGANTCADPLPITVTFSAKLPNNQQQRHTYQLNPDRRNIMGYFGETCNSSTTLRLSAGQVQIIRDALRLHNRRHLTAAD